MHYGEHWWQRVWKILDAKGAAGLPIAEGNEFWLEPKDIDGETVFYYVRFEDGGMLDLWKDVRLFPVGTRAPQATLDPWDGANGPLKLQYMAKAQEIAQADDVDITERPRRRDRLGLGARGGAFLQPARCLGWARLAHHRHHREGPSQAGRHGPRQSEVARMCGQGRPPRCEM
jgi:hypothetical protein